MANHLDLDEQEQLDEFKHFWNQYGNLITWVLIFALGAFAAWSGVQYWQRSQAVQSAAMFDEVERSIASKDVAKIERALTDMNAKFGSSAYAQQSNLLAAKVFFEQGNTDATKKALMTVIENSKDEGYQAIAKLRLAGVFIESKNFEGALKQLGGTYPKDFTALADDRRGDVFALQNKLAEAKLEYVKAYKALDERLGYRRLVEVKINALGGDPTTTTIPPNIKAEVVTK
jgi:predicted negative regulator of RcsB-dependent stress response